MSQQPAQGHLPEVALRVPGPALVAGYLADADPDRPFPLPHNTGLMLHADMTGARAAWIADKALSPADRQARDEDPDFLMPGDSAGLLLDFHSFRHGYVTAICRANVSPRVILALTRHSDHRLTMSRYSRVAVTESATALDALPKLTGEPDAPQAQRATGTMDARQDRADLCAAPCAKFCQRGWALPH